MHQHRSCSCSRQSKWGRPFPKTGWPFNSTVDNPTTVSLATTRKNLYYTVEATVESHTGEVGEIHITDKALNGFKVSYDGPATSVNIILRIKGGMA